VTDLQSTETRTGPLHFQAGCDMIYPSGTRLLPSGTTYLSALRTVSDRLFWLKKTP